MITDDLVRAVCGLQKFVNLSRRNNSNLIPWITAQWCFESGYGVSDLAMKANNYGGMKYRPKVAKKIKPSPPFEYADWAGEKELYHSCLIPEDYAELYFTFLDRSRYDGKEDFVKKPAMYFLHIVRCGYCSSMVGVEPAAYVDALIKIMNGRKFLELGRRVAAAKVEQRDEMPEWLRI